MFLYGKLYFRSIEGWNELDAEVINARNIHV